MKKIFLLLTSLFFVACASDNDRVIYDSGLEGEWVLTNVSCFCAFDPEINFSETHIIFDVNAGTVTVINAGDYQFFKENGVYYYGGEGNTLGFPDNTVYQFSINGNKLSLIYLDNPNIADDEVSYNFVRL
ncbi:hypothetical protein ACOCEA_06350 [Maribacter sp. CXY002]|uniref:hypothetical protein n=1 Tax=Maribacter luteocoastalis TaxID=3407671 RepID=UPI003B67E749